MFFSFFLFLMENMFLKLSVALMFFFFHLSHL